MLKLAIVLFMSSIASAICITPVKDDPFHGMVSPTFALFACDFGAHCNYATDSILQLHACGSAYMLGNKPLRDMITCERFEDKASCEKSSAPECQWVENSSEQQSVFGPGACAHASFSSELVGMGLSMFYETLQQTGAKDLPNAAQMYDCIQHSFGPAANCTSQKDRKGRSCGWCPDVASEQLQFTTPQLENVCTQEKWLSVTCPQLQRRAPPCHGAPVSSTTTGAPSNVTEASTDTPASSATVSSATHSTTSKAHSKTTTTSTREGLSTTTATGDAITSRTAACVVLMSFFIGWAILF